MEVRAETSLEQPGCTHYYCWTRALGKYLGVPGTLASPP